MMTTTTNLPPGMALVETWNGRWFAAFAPETEHPGGVLFLEDTATLFPPALDLYDNPQQGYSYREAAIEAWHAWHEAAALPDNWHMLAAQTEIYPERNAWYLDEITWMTGGKKPMLHFSIEVYVIVVATCYGDYQAISSVGKSPDEAIEALYGRVYEWFCKQQTMQQRAS